HTAASSLPRLRPPHRALLFFAACRENPQSAALLSNGIQVHTLGFARPSLRWISSVLPDPTPRRCHIWCCALGLAAPRDCARGSLFPWRPHRCAGGLALSYR